LARVLYHLQRCPDCEKVRLALALEGLAFESRPIDPQERSEVERVSGQSSVPVLVDANGEVLSEANAILTRLAERRGSRLLPEGRRDRALAWALVHQADARLRPLASKIRRRQDADGTALTERELSELRDRLSSELAALEPLLDRGEFLFGAHPTVADVAAHAYLGRLPAADQESVLGRLPRIATWFRRLREAAFGAAAKSPPR